MRWGYACLVAMPQRSQRQAHEAHSSSHIPKRENAAQPPKVTNISGANKLLHWLRKVLVGMSAQNFEDRHQMTRNGSLMSFANGEPQESRSRFRCRPKLNRKRNDVRRVTGSLGFVELGFSLRAFNPMGSPTEKIFRLSFSPQLRSDKLPLFKVSMFSYRSLSPACSQNALSGRYQKSINPPM